ncbi:hypothetical protein NUH88_11410 [Nisaea acidiphila]|uniref:Uncharacterized protein n=1 Tax=Nisaea acidiphila TaxID=1862145 RepID=A0A9J7AM40_9PROT|nr:hypothetical protein [Nisaea acidiphila]UUX48026.1 hypothetical protein NUH88_11410 [Nisaea acidiphila]
MKTTLSLLTLVLPAAIVVFAYAACLWREVRVYKLRKRFNRFHEKHGGTIGLFSLYFSLKPRVSNENARKYGLLLAQYRVWSIILFGASLIIAMIVAVGGPLLLQKLFG